MKIKLQHQNNYHSKITDEKGYAIDIDNLSTEHPKGASPMGLLLMGVAGCSSIDIVAILKKQKIVFDDLRIEVEGTREPGQIPALFKTIDVKVFVEGDVRPDRIYRSAQLSFEKYCSVSKTLEPTATIKFSVIVNDIPYEPKT